MSEPYDGPDLKPEVQVDDKKPEEVLVVPQEGILEGDSANVSFARDILASVVDEVIRRSKVAPADNVYTSSLDKVPARGNVSNIPIERDILDKSVQLEHLIDWDDTDSKDSFFSLPENEQNTSLQNNIIHQPQSNDEEEKFRDLNPDPKIGILCFSSLESLGSLKELPSGTKVILDILSRRTLETSQAKDAKQSCENESLKEPHSHNIKSEEKIDNSFSETLNTITSVAILSNTEQINDSMEKNKPGITLSNIEELMKTYNAEMISKETRENREQIVESNGFKMSNEEIPMEKSVSERGNIASRKAEVKTDSSNVMESVDLRQTTRVDEALANTIDDTGVMKRDITDSESSVTTTKEEFTKIENTDIKEDTADNVEDNSHGQDTPSTSDAKNETPETEQESTCNPPAEITVHSATLHAPDKATEDRSTAPVTAKCPIERPAGGVEAKAEGSSESPRSLSAGARRAPSPLPPPPPLVAELTRQSPSAEQLRVALAKEFSSRAARAAGGPEYDLFWSTVGLLRRYEDPMRPTSSQAPTTRTDGERKANAERSAVVEGEGDEDEGEEDEEVAAAIDAINALFPRDELEEDEDEEDEDDLDEVPPKHVMLQRDNDEEEFAVHPTPSFRRVLSVPGHSTATSISKPLVPYLPTPTPFTPQPATTKEKKSLGKRLRNFFAHPFGNKKKKAKTTGNLSVP